MKRPPWPRLLLLGALLPLIALVPGPAGRAQTGARTFPETGKTVTGRFLDYWLAHGGLAQEGFPISDPLQETSDTDGHRYQVQYFERAIFELHPEYAPPYDVLLALLGNFRYRQQYPSGAPNQVPNTAPGSVFFKETGKRLGGRFLDYWQAHGGLAQQGYPISDEFPERSDLNGQVYTVQYFERAVFEAHPENTAPYDVLLSQLGTFRYQAKYGGPRPTPSPSGCTAPVAPGTWAGRFTTGATWQGQANGVFTDAGTVRLTVACDGSLSGTWATTQFTYRSVITTTGPRTTCTASSQESFTGDAEIGPSGLPRLVFNVPRVGGGRLACTDLGSPINLALIGGIHDEVPVETVVADTLTGSRWAFSPEYVLIDELHLKPLALPDSGTLLTTTGAWELTRQP
ncbi:MAG TPA: hypothetical protein VKY74_16375 [Chloroflexia bacterium]|nr:hypothetical protein [Chloroflexia bacterium]